MKAIQVAQYGNPDVLKIQEIQIGTPKKGEVLVKTEFAGVNYIDIYQRSGFYKVPLPFIPGLEASGVVEAIGAGVKSVKVGDRVAYVHQTAAYAEKNLVKADHLIILQDDVSFEEGAAFPLQGMTAHYLINEFHKIKKGDNVLIHAAAGGMGLLLVQWAKYLGAKVFGTVSSQEKAKIAKEAGVDEIILYTEQDFATEIKRLTNNHGADLIIDGVGKTTFLKNFEAAAICGHIVVYGSASGAPDPFSLDLLKQRSLTLSSGMLGNFILTNKEFKKRGNDVLHLMEKGVLKLKIDTVFPLASANLAHERLASRESSGKILLKPS